MKSRVIEQQYNISPRIEAEEWAMDSASLVIASTRQEVEQQYSLYDNYHPKRMHVIPPGTDLSRFRPPNGTAVTSPIQDELGRFLTAPGKPMVLALSRADERKNIQTLVKAFGRNTRLRNMANLVIVAGNRDDIATLDRGARKVLTDVLLLIDSYDLYGSVAYPKHHTADDVPELYRLAARTQGVFVNPALTEPFGLTLVEAAASGLPVVATEDGGPRDIIGECHNGLLIDPLDSDAMGAALVDALSEKKRWRAWAANGIRGAHRRYSWDSHVERYLKATRRLLGKRRGARVVRPQKSRLPTVDRLVVCDIDDTLLGDSGALEALIERLAQAGKGAGFGVATGRQFTSAVRALDKAGVPMPDLLITSVGTEIHYGPQLTVDRSWARHIRYRWNRERIVEVLAETPGLRRQAKEEQTGNKISYFIDPDKAPGIRDIVRHLRSRDLHANVIYSHGMYLDILPIRASKGQALRYVGAKWGIPPERMLVAGQSGNDVEMLRGNTLGVVVGNYSHELRRLRGEPLIYFAEGAYASGVMEGMEYYDFLGAIRLPSQEDG